MIIIMTDNLINKRAAETLNRFNQYLVCYWPQIDFTKLKSDKLIIIQLNPGDFVPALLRGRAFAGILCKNGLPENVKTIDLLISNLEPDVSMHEFAQQLADTLIQDYKRDITVRFVFDTRRSFTLLVPPSHSKDNQWEVYGIKYNDLPKDKINFENLYNLEQKTLLWSGDYLDKWLSAKERTCVGKDIVVPPIRIKLK